MKADPPPRIQRWATLTRNVARQRDLLGQQEERIMWQLLRTPFLAASDLAALLQVDHTTVYAYLQALCASGLLEFCRIPAAGVNRRLFLLTNSGVYLLASLIDRDPLALAQNTHTEEASLLSLLPRLPQLARVQSILFALLAGAPRAQQQTKHALQWTWKREVAVAGITMGLPCLDASLAWSYHSQTDWYSALFVLETDLLLRDVVIQKLEYLFHVRAHEPRSFPPVLLLVETQDQQQCWSEEMQRIAHVQCLSPLIGASLDMSCSRTSPWERNWSHFAERRPCSLDEVLMPVSAEQVPTFLLSPEPPVPAGSFNHSLSIIKGQFFERAMRVKTDLRSNKEQEVNLSLLSLCLGGRHLTILSFLYRLPFLTAEALASVLTSQQASPLRYLRELEHFGLVGRTQANTLHWFVTVRGLQFIALTHHLPIEVVQAHARALWGREWGHDHAPALCPYREPFARLTTFARLLVLLQNLSSTQQDLVRLREWDVGPAANVSEMHLALEVRSSGRWRTRDLYVIWISGERDVPWDQVKKKVEVFLTPGASVIVLVAKKEVDRYVLLENRDSRVKVTTLKAMERSFAALLFQLCSLRNRDDRHEVEEGQQPG